MKKHGKVLRWNAARGFGFIRGRETDQEIFFHIKDFRSASAPKDGDEVWFEEIHVGGKGPRAMSVHRADAPNPALANKRNSGVNLEHTPVVRKEPILAKRQVSKNHMSGNAGAFFFLVLAWLALIAWGVWVKRLAVWIPGLAIALNLLAFYIYSLD